jgi:hypothetical protein
MNLDTTVENAIEIVANILYLLKHEADDPTRVHELVQMAEPSIALLLRSVATQPEDPR